jgi:hypothetical protein
MTVTCAITIDGQAPLINTFASLPRVGEIVFILVDGDGDMFRVERVVHFAANSVPGEPEASIQISVTRRLLRDAPIS